VPTRAEELPVVPEIPSCATINARKITMINGSAKIGRASCRERVGIRDVAVAGVQTCALPICADTRRRASRRSRDSKLRDDQRAHAVTSPDWRIDAIQTPIDWMSGDARGTAIVPQEILLTLLAAGTAT